MSIDSLIAVLGLVLGVYAIMPRVRQLDLRLRMRMRDWVFVVVVVLLVNYLVLYSEFAAIGLTPGLDMARFGLTPGVAAYLTVFFGAVFLAIDLHFFHVSAGRIKRFRKLFDELAWEESYPQLLQLLEDHLAAIWRVYRGRSWIARVKAEWARKPALEAALNGHAQPTWLQARVAGWLPSFTDEAAAASEILRHALTSEPLVRALARSRPYLGLKVFDLDSHSIHDFCDLYFRALLDTPGSVWYVEIRHNVNMSNHCNYHYPPSNPFLTYFCANPHNAERLDVYRPVGEFVLAHVDLLARDPEHDQYNWAMDKSYDEEGRWRCPLWTAVFFFDLMVSSALWRGIKWHMWLYYYTNFVRSILRNCDLDRDPLVDKEAVPPTRYVFLLYEIMRNLSNWVRELEYIPATQENTVLETEEPEHENGNIPKSAILALGQSVHYICEAPNIPDSVRDYLLEVPISLFFFLRRLPGREAYARALTKSLSTGGGLRSAGEREAVQAGVLRAYSGLDTMRYPGEHAKELLALLSE